VSFIYSILSVLFSDSMFRRTLGSGDDIRTMKTSLVGSAKGEKSGLGGS
jgi:hypothetical protein